MKLAEQIRATSLKTRARLTGAVYLAYFVAAFAATAFDPHGEVARAVNLLSILLYALLTVLFYFMFKPVGRAVSMLAAVFSFLGCIFSVIQTLHLAPPTVSPLAFFGIYCLFIGELILRSGFLPKLLGMLLIVAGVGWLLVLFPFTKPLNVFTEFFGVIAEGSLCLWLLIAGVSPRRSKK